MASRNLLPFTQSLAPPRRQLDVGRPGIGGLRGGCRCGGSVIDCENLSTAICIAHNRAQLTSRAQSVDAIGGQLTSRAQSVDAIGGRDGETTRAQSVDAIMLAVVGFKFLR